MTSIGQPSLQLRSRSTWAIGCLVRITTNAQLRCQITLQTRNKIACFDCDCLHFLGVIAELDQWRQNQQTRIGIDLDLLVYTYGIISRYAGDGHSQHQIIPSVIWFREQVRFAVDGFPCHYFCDLLHCISSLHFYLGIFKYTWRDLALDFKLSVLVHFKHQHPIRSMEARFTSTTKANRV